MNNQKLKQLYQKMIIGTSPNYSLINPVKLGHVTKLHTPSQFARFRFSEQYLNLIHTEKITKSTFDSLQYLYNSHYGYKKGDSNRRSIQFYEFIFEHLFSQKQKIVLQKMVEQQFTNKKLKKANRPKLQRIKMMNEMIVNMNKKSYQKEQIHLIKPNKSLFVQILNCLLVDEELQKEKEKKKVQNKQKRQKKDEEQFSLQKMMAMII